MKILFSAVLIVITLLILTGVFSASAQEPVGADCTDPPNLVPFADLRNCDLSGRNMEGVDLNNADLTGANLDNASLFTSNLVAATFDNASLQNTNLEDGYAPGGSFINADLRGANLYFAFFRGGNLSGANFSNQYLSSVDFESAILQNAVFTSSFLFGVDMRNSDLRGADLRFTSLAYVSLNNANFSNATLLGAERGDGVDFSGVIWGNTTCADGSNSDDNDGDNFSCEGNFPENVPPTITLTSPADGSSVPFGETITISADAADSDGSIRRVEFYADGALLVYDVVAPYSFDWTNVNAGPHEIYAIAYDDNGIFAGDEASTQSETVTVIVEAQQHNQPPAVAITSPANNATVSRLLGTTIRANASDSDGNITKVEFYAGSTLLCTDTSAAYSCFWRPTSRGNFTLTAMAYDNSGAVTSSNPVTVRVK